MRNIQRFGESNHIWQIIVFNELGGTKNQWSFEVSFLSLSTLIIFGFPKQTGLQKLFPVALWKVEVVICEVVAKSGNDNSIVVQDTNFESKFECTICDYTCKTAEQIIYAESQWKIQPSVICSLKKG